MSATCVIRQATPDDADQIASFRRLMFTDMGDYDPSAMAAMEIDHRLWVKKCLEQGKYWGWLALNDAGEIIGSAGLWLQEWPPHPLDLTQSRGHIMDVYVRPEYRRRGIARQLMETILAWCQARQMLYVMLSSSHAGRPLYDSLGFDATNILSKNLSKPRKE